MAIKNKTLQSNKKIRTRKSEAMTPQECRAFDRWVKKQPTKIDAAEIVGVTRGALDDLLNRGTGKPANIAKIRTLITEAA